MKSKSYNEKSIRVLEFPDNVRAKPSMYLGERGDYMAFTAIREAMDNAVDERLAGRNKLLEVFADNKNNRFIVADGGVGIPVGMNKEYKQSTLTLVLTKLHAGGKLVAEESTYKSSRGTHGVGVSCTNAISLSFKVWTFRDGDWHHQAFEKGVAVTKVIKQKPPKDIVSSLQKKYKRGTILEIKLDQSIVSEDKGKTKAKVERKTLMTWLKNTALMVGDLEVVANVDGKKKSWYNDKGIQKILKIKLKKMGEPETMGRPFIYDDGVYKAAMQWSSYAEDDGLASHVNALATPQGGEHMNGFKAALARAIADVAKAKGKKGEDEDEKPKKSARKTKGKRTKKAKAGTYTSGDLLYGLVGIFNVDMQSPEFTNQLKEKLASKISKEVEDVMYKALKEYFAKNKTLAKKIIRRAMDIKKTKEDFQKLMKGVSAIKNSGGGKLPSKLTAAKGCKPEKRELYLVEGDSAMGCFVGDTPVLLSDGSTVRFDEMVNNPKDYEGFGFNRETKRREPFLFDEPRITKHVTELIEVELSDGTIWRCTTDHPWLLENNVYIAAEDLRPDDKLQCVSVSPKDEKKSS